ncbi:hypothetical protein AGLY_001342 [Aphis glycines]|uniref:Uncharacterized protein n=1 Tax=Aphis glycines TaxID=307491 RepID=A0A6G0U5E5_APHGL|nr:hypothetical protein AGLY_001342 [Aphis glycines]
MDTSTIVLSDERWSSKNATFEFSMKNETDLVLEKHFLILSKKIMNLIFKFEPYKCTYPDYKTISIVIIGSTLRLNVYIINIRYLCNSMFCTTESVEPRIVTPWYIYVIVNDVRQLQHRVSRKILIIILVKAKYKMYIISALFFIALRCSSIAFLLAASYFEFTTTGFFAFVFTLIVLIGFSLFWSSSSGQPLLLTSIIARISLTNLIKYLPPLISTSLPLVIFEGFIFGDVIEHFVIIFWSSMLQLTVRTLIGLQSLERLSRFLLSYCVKDDSVFGLDIM